MTDKPKGGRGKKAPYETKQMRIPQPIAAQVEALCSRYQDFLVLGGDPANPPSFLEKLETTEPAAAPGLLDLYAARDAVLKPGIEGWRLERKLEKRERFFAFANALIDEISKLDPNYTALQRLQSDLKQEREWSAAMQKGKAEEWNKRVELEKKLGLRKY
jgi:hypothetical protein